MVKRSHTESQKGPDGNAIDPVCGMTISADGEITRDYEGETFHLCSQVCARKFDQDAIAYVATSRLNLEGWGRTPPPPGFKKKPR